MTTYNPNVTDRVVARRRLTLQTLYSTINARPRRSLATGVTISPYTAAVSIPSPVYARPWANGGPNTSAFTFCGAPNWKEKSYAGSGAIEATTLPGGFVGTLPGNRIRFLTWAPVFEIQLQLTSVAQGASGLGYYLWVDGELANNGALLGVPTTTGDDFAARVYKVTFGSGLAADARPRIIELEASAHGATLWWVATSAQYPVHPAPQPDGLRCAIIGDSMSEQLAMHLGRAIGQADTIGISRGSTGWTSPGSFQVIGNRLSADLFPLMPDVVFECGGRNDTVNTQALQDAYQELLEQQYARIIGNDPDVIIVSTGVLCSGNSSNTSYARHNAAKRLAAAEFPHNVIFLDTIGSAPWVTGTGRVGAVANNGNADWVVTSDGVHPTWEGIELFAQRIAMGTAAGIPSLLAKTAS